MWDLLERCQSQVKVMPMGGIMGLDFQSMLTMSKALGYESAGIAFFLPFAEAGMLNGIAKNSTDN